jgi:hypothetical protein
MLGAMPMGMDFGFPMMTRPAAPPPPECGRQLSPGFGHLHNYVGNEPGGMPTGAQFYCCPLSANTASASFQPAVPPVPAVMQCMATTSATRAGHGWSMCVVTESEKARLEMCDTERRIRGCTDNWVMKIAGSEFRCAVTGKQVAMSGPGFVAMADRMEARDSEGCFLFEGHVRLRYEKDGQKAEVAGATVEVDLTTGQVSILTAGSKASPPNQHSQFARP